MVLSIEELPTLFLSAQRLYERTVLLGVSERTVLLGVRYAVPQAVSHRRSYWWPGLIPFQSMWDLWMTLAVGQIFF
jgi:hypothetical protein